MIVDSSALVAILTDEPEAVPFSRLLAGGAARMSVDSWLEASIVADRLAPRGGARFDQVVAGTGIELVAVTVEHAEAARAAHRRFGRGSGSPARLNYGDCFAYALARVSDEPLLFKGDDFTHTDVTPAQPR